MHKSVQESQQSRRTGSHLVSALTYAMFFMFAMFSMFVMFLQFASAGPGVSAMFGWLGVFHRGEVVFVMVVMCV